MVPKSELEELFEYRDGFLYGKHVIWRRKDGEIRYWPDVGPNESSSKK